MPFRALQHDFELTVFRVYVQRKTWVAKAAGVWSRYIVDGFH